MGGFAVQVVKCHHELATTVIGHSTINVTLPKSAQKKHLLLVFAR